MDPVAQVLAQQSSGSAEGQGFGEYFVRGQQLNLSKRRMMLEEAQNNREKDLQPLRMRAMELGNQSAGLQVSAQFDQWDAKNQQDSILPDIYRLQAAFSRSPNGYSDPTLIDEVEKLGMIFPKAMTFGAGLELMQNVRAVPMLRQKFNEIRQFNNQLKGTGLLIQQYNPKTGNIELMREQSSIPPGMQETNELDQLRKQIEAETDPIRKADLEKTYAIKESKYLPQPNSEKVYDANGNVVYERSSGKQAGGAPVATITAAEKAGSSAVNLVEMANEIMRLTNGGGTTGVSGNLRRLSSEIGGQFGIDVDANSAFDFSQATALYRANAVQILRSDSQISEPERKAIINDLPNSTLLESDASAKRKAAYATVKVAESAKRQLKRAGRPIPPQLMSHAEIAQAVREKKITAREAVEALQVTPFP